VSQDTIHPPTGHVVTKETARMSPLQFFSHSLTGHSHRARRLWRGLSAATLVVAFLVGAAALTAPAAQAAPGPWWHLTSRMYPAHLAPGGEATIIVRAENIGDAPSAGPITLNEALPSGVVRQSTNFYSYALGTEPEHDFGPEGGLSFFELCRASSGAAVCETGNEALGEFNEPIEPIVPFEYLEMVLRVKNEGAVAADAQSHAEVSGGGGPARALDSPLPTDASPVGFGAEQFQLRPEEEGGALASRAGSHPFQLTTTFALNQTASLDRPPAIARELDFRLPPGLVGNAVALPKCTELQFSHVREGGEVNFCPQDSAIGVVTITFFETVHLGLKTYSLPLFNLTPAFGEPARFGFVFAQAPIALQTAVRSGPGEDYGVTVSTKNLTQLTNAIAAEATFWGDPENPVHDEARGFGCLTHGRWQPGSGLTCEPTHPTASRAFLTMPTSCTMPFSSSVSGLSWPNLQAPQGASLAPLDSRLENGSGVLSGCNQLPFAPRVQAQPTSTAAASPTGLNFDLDFEDQGLESPTTVAESTLKKAIVALPAGVTTNPAVAGGLAACSQAQYNQENLENEAGCPEASKIGEVEIESPLVEPTIDGAIYVAAQHDNPAGNLLSIYMVAKNPELGVLVRSAGAVTPDPKTGQLTTAFDELPQLPFSHFHLHFREGQRAPLIAPGLCGKYTTQADLYPYSNPEVPVHREATFTVASPCPATESQEPNKPAFEAGTTSPIAGAYAPFVFKVSREDGSQVLSQISATLPEGLLGKLAGVSECSNAAIAAAEARSGEGQGQAELASPSCPAQSQVGVVNVGTGAGSQPYYVQGKAYLAGPYKGAPLSLAIITPAIAGPFDLGTVAVRTALHVDETTAQIHAISDPLPTILHGLPLVVRSVVLNMDRSNFTLNPTSCDPMSVTGSATSTLGNVAPLTQRFQVGACGALGFKPELKLSYSGQTKRAGNPALRSVIAYPKGSYANIARASVTLPKGVLIANAHINNPCTRVQFNSTPLPGEACPPKSVLGTAKVWTPLLEAPESGKVYFRSNGGERELPDLVVALRGQIPVQLVGFIDSVGKKHAEVRRVRTRFQSVPDAPVSRFELKLYGGKRGLLESSQNLCKGSPPATIALTAQNGKTYDTEPTVSTACGKKSKHKKKSGKKK
jgi:hypothetical protein